jgi:hypothetical protein
LVDSQFRGCVEKTKGKKDEIVASFLKDRKGSGFLTAFGSEFSADEC